MGRNTIENFIARACGRENTLPAALAFFAVLALVAAPLAVFGQAGPKTLTPAEAAAIGARLQACEAKRKNAAALDPEALMAEFSGEAAEHVRRCQIGLAVKLGQKARTMLRAGLRDGDAQVRQTAVEGLMRLRVPEDSAAILDAYKREKDPGVKARVARRLEWLKGAKAADLEAVKSDADPKVRELAAGAKGREDARKTRAAKKAAKKAPKGGKKR